MAINADTVLASDVIELLASIFLGSRGGRGEWIRAAPLRSDAGERGRYIEYLYSFTFHKQVQDY